MKLLKHMRSLIRNKMQLKSYLLHREKKDFMFVKNKDYAAPKTTTSCRLLLVKVPYIFCENKEIKKKKFKKEIYR